MYKRVEKQIVIGLIFILVIGGIGYGFIDYFFIIEPTCFDGIRNGKEEGVDCSFLVCGVACEPEILPLNIISQRLIEIKENDYDFVARINNPNSFFGASLVRYKLNIRENDGTILDNSGTFYILPGQTRFLIVPGIRTANGAAAVSIDITEIEWEKVEAFGNINFSVQRKSYSVIDQNGVFSELEAVILNDSDFDFDKVEVEVILFDENNEIIAVNRTDIRTFLSRTERHFKASWPVELPETIRQDIELLTNVFENSNFIKRYGTQERFKKYY